MARTSKKVMEKIREIKMRPKAYFVLGSMLLGAGIVGFLSLAVVLAGAVWFRLRMQGAIGYLRFGPAGLRFFTELFPWRTVILAAAGLAGGSYLLKKYDRVYKLGLGWLLLGAGLTVLGLGLAADRAGMNEKLQQVKLVKPIYEMRFKTESWLVGEIVELGENEVLVVTPEGEEVMVSLGGTIKKPGRKLVVGDKIRVIGELKDGVFEAEGMMPGGLRWSPMPRIRRMK